MADIEILDIISKEVQPEWIYSSFNLQKHCWTFRFYDRRRNLNNCMVCSWLNKIASFLPRLRHLVPIQDWAEHGICGVRLKIQTTGHIQGIANRCSFQSCSWWRKLAALHFPPVQSGATSVSGNLGGGKSQLCFSVNQPQCWKGCPNSPDRPFHQQQEEPDECL